MARQLVQTCAALGIMCALGAGASVPSASATPGWVGTSSLSEAPNGKHPQVAVATDAKGDTLVVWCQSVGASETIDAAWRPAGGTFSEPVEVSPTGDSAYHPVVAMEPQGNAIIAWLSRSIGSYEDEGYAEARSRAADGTLGTPVVLSQYPESEDPAVAMDSEGDGTVAWLQYTGGGREVEASIFADGRFSKRSVLSTRNPGSEGITATSPMLTSNFRGETAITWSAAEADQTGRPTSHYFMQLMRRSSGNVFGPAIDLLSECEGSPTVTMDAGGDVAMTWTRGGIVEAATLASNSATFDAPTVLSNFNTRLEGILNTQPTVAMDAAGEALVTWLSGTQPIAAILGGPLGEPVELAKAGAKASAPATAMDAQGDSMTVWIGEGGNHEGIPMVEGSARPAGGHFNPPLSLPTNGNVTTPIQVAIDSQGDAVSAWSASNGTRESIQVAGYQTTGPRLEALQAPTEGQAGAPLAFSVSPLSVWSTVASTTWSWGDGSPTTSGTDVAHVFDAPGTYQVSVSATDALGNVTNATRTVTIQAAPTVHTNPEPTPTLPKPEPQPKPKPKAKEAVVPVFTPLFATKAAIGGSTLGLFVEIASVRGARAGDTIVVRCTAGCQRPLHETVRVRKHHNARGTIAISPPLVVSQTTRVEIEVLAPGRVPRFVQYRFIRAGGKLIAHPTNRGCLSPTGRSRSCP
jgi:hypothetical protein